MKSIKFFTLLLVAGTYVACSDQLEIEPFQSIDAEFALTTDERVDAVLIGAYDAISNDELENPVLWGGDNLRNAELLGGTGELLWVGTFNGPREIATKQITTGNNEAQETWMQAYNAINITNNVLSALDVVDEDERDRVEGEARFIRAAMYFDLVRFYAQPYEGGETNNQLGVPLVLTPTDLITDANNVARNSVEEVYAQIIDDLDMSADLLSEVEDNEPFATAEAATALLSRVYLQMDRYEEARDLADAVIESGKFELADDYDRAFMNQTNSGEDIFAIQVSTQDGTNGMNLFFSVPQYGGRDGDIIILEDHLALYEEGDERLDLFFTSSGDVFTGKYNDQFANVGIIRLAEMYLIRAEANERLETEVGATPLEDINRLRNRAGLDDLEEVDLDYILEERRRELAFEGFRIHDIKRLQGTVGTFDYDAPELVFPIPAREVVANPNLVQNEGYN